MHCLRLHPESWEDKGVFFFYKELSLTYFISYPEIFQDFDEGGSKIYTRMRLSDFNKVQKHRNGGPLMRKMDGKGNERLMIGRSSRIRSKVELSLILL